MARPFQELRDKMSQEDARQAQAEAREMLKYSKVDPAGSHVHVGPEKGWADLTDDSGGGFGFQVSSSDVLADLADGQPFTAPDVFEGEYQAVIEWEDGKTKPFPVTVKSGSAKFDPADVRVIPVGHCHISEYGLVWGAETHE